MNIALWIIQILLALLFLFAGGTKLYYAPEVLAAMGPPNQVHLPGLFLKFIGACEGPHLHRVRFEGSAFLSFGLSATSVYASMGRSS